MRESHGFTSGACLELFKYAPGMGFVFFMCVLISCVDLLLCLLQLMQGSGDQSGIPHPHIRPRVRRPQQQQQQQHQYQHQQRVLPDYMSKGGGGANDAISLV